MIYLKTGMLKMPKGCAECMFFCSEIERFGNEPGCGAAGSRTSSTKLLPYYLDLEVFKPNWCPLVDGLKEKK